MIGMSLLSGCTSKAHTSNIVKCAVQPKMIASDNFTDEQLINAIEVNHWIGWVCNA